MFKRTFIAVVVGALIAVVSLPPSGEASAEAEDEIRTVFGRFVAAQNAHDLQAVGEILSDSEDFLWITRGTPVWGHGAALDRFEALYEGTWSLEPEMGEFKVFELGKDSAQLFVGHVHDCTGRADCTAVGLPHEPDPGQDGGRLENREHLAHPATTKVNRLTGGDGSPDDCDEVPAAAQAFAAGVAILSPNRLHRRFGSGPVGLPPTADFRVDIGFRRLAILTGRMRHLPPLAVIVSSADPSDRG